MFSRIVGRLGSRKPLSRHGLVSARSLCTGGKNASNFELVYTNDQGRFYIRALTFYCVGIGSACAFMFYETSLSQVLVKDLEEAVAVAEAEGSTNFVSPFLKLYTHPLVNFGLGAITLVLAVIPFRWAKHQVSKVWVNREALQIQFSTFSVLGGDKIMNQTFRIGSFDIVGPKTRSLTRYEVRPTKNSGVKLHPLLLDKGGFYVPNENEVDDMVARNKFFEAIGADYREMPEEEVESPDAENDSNDETDTKQDKGHKVVEKYGLDPFPRRDPAASQERRRELLQKKRQLK